MANETGAYIFSLRIVGNKESPELKQKRKAEAQSTPKRSNNTWFELA